MSSEFRLIVDPALSGVRNMAVDESLLDLAAREQVLTLRFYQWSEPTVSLGYFQRYEDRIHHSTSQNCALVRRQSGGGAIVHDQELTYSLAIPPRHPLSADAEALYFLVHEAIVRCLQASCGIETLRLWEEKTSRLADDEPFLCFQRRSPGDVVIWRNDREHFKVVGSAQRRRRGAVLQHGSILLENSRFAPELAGIREFSNSRFRKDEVVRQLEQAIASALGLCVGDEPVKTSRTHDTGKIEEKHASRDWLARR